MAQAAIRFRNPYQNYSPNTLFKVDEQTKTLSPFSSGKAFTDAGFQFGQEQVIDDPNQFAGFSVGPIIGDRAAALSSVKTELNQFQNDQFGQEAAPKRASSELQSRVKGEQQSLDEALAEFRTLSEKYKALESPNYEQAFRDLRNEQGVPQLEKDFLDVRKTRRELPYTERSNTGNAGIATESQLQAQTAQKDIPLEIREGNLIDRLKLASDFINTSLKLKEMDATSSRTALENAIALVGQSIDLSRTELDRNRARSDAALQFKMQNGINTPFFNAGGVIYDANSIDPVPSEEFFQEKYGMTLQEAEARGLVATLDPAKQEEKALVMDLIAKFPDARIKLSDTLDQAQAKLAGSALYRKTLSSGSGSGSENFGYTLSLRKEFDQQSRNFITVRDSYSRLLAAREQNSAAGDIAMIFSYMKLLDPTSVVREGEQATAQNAAGIPDQIRNAYNKALTGQRLNDNQRTDFVNTAGQLYSSQLEFQNRLRDEFRTTAGQFGLDPIKVAPDLGAGITAPATNSVIDKEIEELQSSGVITGSSQSSSSEGGLVKKVLNFFGI